MADELKPCPFCGSEMEVKSKPDDYARGPGRLYVICDCGAMGAGGKTVGEAIAAWNRRATPATPVGDEGLSPQIQRALDLLADAKLPSDTWRDISNVLHACRDAARRAGSTSGDAEITNEMADAGAAVLYGYPRAKAVEWVKEDKFDSCAEQARETFLAMLAAAPSPQPPAGDA